MSHPRCVGVHFHEHWYHLITLAALWMLLLLPMNGWVCWWPRLSVANDMPHWQANIPLWRFWCIVSTSVCQCSIPYVITYNEASYTSSITTNAWKTQHGVWSLCRDPPGTWQAIPKISQEVSYEKSLGNTHIIYMGCGWPDDLMQLELITRNRKDNTRPCKGQWDGDRGLMFRMLWSFSWALGVDWSKWQISTPGTLMIFSPKLWKSLNTLVWILG